MEMKIKDYENLIKFPHKRLKSLEVISETSGKVQ